ncbi:MAG: hypothetical protein ACAI25_08830 [Planctomycetota bacterium]
MRVLRRSEVHFCSYCRDELDEACPSSCGKRSCTALYHRECWIECFTHFGGCAIPGCDKSAPRATGRSTRGALRSAPSESVTAAAYFLAILVGLGIFCGLIVATFATAPRWLLFFSPGIFYVAASAGLGAARTTCELCGVEFPWRY